MKRQIQAGLRGVLIAAMVRGGTIPARGGAETPTPHRLDLHLKTVLSEVSIEGDWIYRPLDGSGPYLLNIQATRGGFYEFEARREGLSRPLLQFDRAAEDSSYRGEVTERFDPCIPSGARFVLMSAGEGLRLEPALPVSAPVPQVPSAACGGSARYYLAASGRGQEVRLRPGEDLPGGQRAAPGAAGSGTSAPSGSTPTAASAPPIATITLGWPSVPDGSAVLLLGSVRDGNLRLWHHVQLLEPPPTSVGGPSQTARTAGRKVLAGTEAFPNGEAAVGGTAADKVKPKGPTSGYVPAENLVVRWECRLERADRGEPKEPEAQKGAEN